MDLDKEDYVVSMDAVQPDFEIIAKEYQQTTQKPGRAGQRTHPGVTSPR